MSEEGTRNLILETAGQIFADEGFERATVRAICALAGVNVASINYHFGDKATLYLEVVKAAHRMRAEQVPMPVWSDDVPADERLEGFIRTMLTRMLSDRELPWQGRLLMREVLNPTAACRELIADYVKPHHELLKGILLEIAEDTLPANLLDKLAFSVIGQCMFYRLAGGIVELLVGPSRYEPSVQIEELVEHITAFSLGGVRRIAAETVAAEIPVSDTK